VRPTKITTIEAHDAEPVGRLSGTTLAAVMDTIVHLLGR